MGSGTTVFVTTGQTRRSKTTELLEQHNQNRELEDEPEDARETLEETSKALESWVW